MSILTLNKLALDLVARDFSDGHAASNGGPTKTARALAIIHLAAHDAYAAVAQGALTPLLPGLPPAPAKLASDDATATTALLSAGLRAATQLYPDSASFIADAATALINSADPKALVYGDLVGDAWINARKGDGSGAPQSDTLYDTAPGRHRHDPLNPNQQTLGRTWGFVRLFALNSVAADAPLMPPPMLDSAEYAAAYDDVFENGRNDIAARSASYRQHAAIGTFWGYDGSNKLGTPPRLYNQVVVATSELQGADHVTQIRVLTAINVAMADAGIAAWYWKYQYDFWRPVVAIREADAGWGPSHIGDGNALRSHAGDPFWLPLGAPASNPQVAGAAAAPNGTPNFPAYPSGHATFGTACFETAAALLGKTPETITVEFVSDEFNGKTTDNTGVARPVWAAEFTLREAIEQNKVSRIYLGVHWAFDASGGETVGHAVAQKVLQIF